MAPLSPSWQRDLQVLPHPSLLLPSLQAVAKPLLVCFLQVSAPARCSELCGHLSQSPTGSELHEGGVMSFSGISLFPAHRWPGAWRRHLYLSRGQLPSSCQCWPVLPDFLSAQYKGHVKTQNLAASFRIITVSDVLTLWGPLTQQQACPLVRNLMRRCYVRSPVTLE